MNHPLTKLSRDSKLESIVGVFNRLFGEKYRVLLQGGYSEPFYQAPVAGRIGKICFREDYISSALHEVSHWCIAGIERRKVDDYGYWYSPDGRTKEQQAAFESVEAKPQALEWIFSIVTGVDFHISADNLNAGELDLSHFRMSVEAQAKRYLEGGMPEDACAMLHKLSLDFGTDLPARAFFSRSEDT